MRRIDAFGGGVHCGPGLCNFEFSVQPLRKWSSRMKKKIKSPPRAARKRLLQLKAMTTMEELFKQRDATEPGSKEEDQAVDRIMVHKPVDSIIFPDSQQEVFSGR
jgi:hypothetical protein